MIRMFCVIATLIQWSAIYFRFTGDISRGEMGAITMAYIAVCMVYMRRSEQRREAAS